MYKAPPANARINPIFEPKTFPRSFYDSAFSTFKDNRFAVVRRQQHSPVIRDYEFEILIAFWGHCCYHLTTANLLSYKVETTKSQKERGKILGSKIGLVLAVVGGLLYIIAGITLSVSQQVLNMITSYLSMSYPGFSNILVPIVQWLSEVGGIGVILGGIVSYVGFKRIGGIIIVLSVLGGVIYYGTYLYSAWQAGLFSQPVGQVMAAFLDLGLGFFGTVLSVAAYIKR